MACWFRTLAEYPVNESIECLTEPLKDENSGIRSRSAQALGRIGSDSRLNYFINALYDKDPLVRDEAALGLSARMKI